MAITYAIARKRGFQREATRATFKEIAVAFYGAILALAMPVIIIGGILSGIFTATEAAGVSVAYAVFVGCLVTRELKWRHFTQALSRCAIVSAVVFLLVATSTIVSWVLTVSMVPATLSVYLREITQNRFVFLLLVNILLLTVGCLIDNIAAMIMIAPILAPIAEQYGIDSLHFGIIFVVNSVLGMLTPPVGAVLFTVCGVAKAPIEQVAKETMPFLLWEICVLLLVTYFPIVSMGLPHLFGFGR
jgi:tripartite ATP-independent transporter DctM subunit